MSFDEWCSASLILVEISARGRLYTGSSQWECSEAGLRSHSQSCTFGRTCPDCRFVRYFLDRSLKMEEPRGFLFWCQRKATANAWRGVLEDDL